MFSELVSHHFVIMIFFLNYEQLLLCFFLLIMNNCDYEFVSHNPTALQRTLDDTCLQNSHVLANQMVDPGTGSIENI